MPWKEPGEKPREPNEPSGSGDRPGDSDGSGDRDGARERPDDRKPNRLSGQRPGGNNFDLQAQLKRLRQRFGQFGGGPTGLIVLIVVAILVWFAMGSWTLIDAREAGILLRFGQYEATLQPGLHMHLPQPLAQVLTVDVGRSRTVSDQLRMLTRDGQIALVDFFVQYKVADPRKFLFAAREPEDAMRQAALAVVRAQVGTQTMQQLGAQTGTGIGGRIRSDLQHLLDGYDSGIKVTEVGIQNVSVPQEAQAAWSDIGNARQDAQRMEGDAHSAVTKSESDVQAQAAQMHADAEAYKTSHVAAAQAEAARFKLILDAYHAAPQVTRKKLWLQTMQEVLAKNHVVVNSGGGSVVIQMPPRTITPDDSERNPSEPAAAASAPAPASTSGAAKTPTPATSKAGKAQGGAT